MIVSRHSARICLMVVGGLLFLVGCSPFSSDTTPTSPAIDKVLATVYLSPTPDAQQAAATRAASSPTPIPATATIQPSPSPYVGVFRGEAPPRRGFAIIQAPFFEEDNSSDTAPTADASVCGIPIEGAFINVWRENQTVRQRIGCPIQIGFGFFGDTQIFEDGVMYHQPDISAVWAITPDNPRGSYYYLEAPANRPIERVTAPPQLQLPEGIFADMWLSVQTLPDEIGFAQTDTQNASIVVQRFENGTFFLDASAEQIFALIVDGTAYGPYLAPDNAQIGDINSAATATPGASPSPLPPDAP